MALNLANVQTSDTFQTWFTRTNQIIGLAAEQGSLANLANTVIYSGAVANKYGSNTSPIVYTVTVGSKSSNHPFNGIGSGSAYYVNGIESPALQLRGINPGYPSYYKFDQSDGTNSTHPLRFYLDKDKTIPFTRGVTVNGAVGNPGAATWITVDKDTPNIIYYQCQSHPYMGYYAQSDSVNFIHASLTANTVAANTITVTGTGQLKLPAGNTAQRVSNTVGALRYNNETNQFEGYSSAGWGQIGGGGLGKFEFVANTYTAESGNRVAVNTSTTAFTVTLPSSPSADDIVEFIDQKNTFNQNNLTIARNGSTIEGLSQDLIADISSTNFYMQYDGSTWKVFGIASGTQYFSGTLSVNALDVTTNIGANTISAYALGVTTSITGNTAAFAGEVSAQDFNTTSDIGLKNSVATIGNANEIIENLRGVSFRWNSTDKPAYGVVAQEVEEVLPELVVDNKDGIKSVKYLGLIGFLIESNKQLIQRMETLEQKLRDN